MLKVDLGCGPNPLNGFVGVDRFPFENVDVVADINCALPFDDDTVDLLYASHSLEHVEDIMATMREVYRVCKHGAQVCIIAPYNEQKLNVANPYHLNVFNEHTPRFWTHHNISSIKVDEYKHPHAKNWGLSYSDHSEPGLDIRLVNMEFFYFPEYVNLSANEQRRARHGLFDVCDQIMYNLVVWKKQTDPDDIDFNSMVSKFIPFEPEYITKRKLEERMHLIRMKDEELADIKQEKSELERKIKSMDVLLCHYQAKFISVSDSLSEMEKDNESLRNKLSSIDVVRSKLLNLESELSRELSCYDQVVVHDGVNNVNYKDSYNKIVSDIYNQLICYHSTRYFSLKSMLSRDILWDLIDPEFNELKKYTEKHFKRKFSSHFTLSKILNDIPYHEYEISYRVASLKGISLAIRPFINADRGVVGVELVSASNDVLAHETVYLKDISSHVATKFTMTNGPLLNLESGWKLRVFVRDVDVPVSIFELKNYNIFRSRINHSPFTFIEE